ncbi:MAG: hypothetical protein ACFFG0_52110 [Candidatus Thorarchaeota archaeon]
MKIKTINGLDAIRKDLKEKEDVMKPKEWKDPFWIIILIWLLLFIGLFLCIKIMPIPDPYPYPFENPDYFEFEIKNGYSGNAYSGTSLNISLFAIPYSGYVEEEIENMTIQDFYFISNISQNERFVFSEDLFYLSVLNDSQFTPIWSYPIPGINIFFVLEKPNQVRFNYTLNGDTLEGNLLPVNNSLIFEEGIGIYPYYNYEKDLVIYPEIHLEFNTTSSLSWIRSFEYNGVDMLINKQIEGSSIILQLNCWISELETIAIKFNSGFNESYSLVNSSFYFEVD